MRRFFRNRDITFLHEDDCLVRTVSGADGRSYTHRCELPVYEQVAWHLEQTPAEGRGTTLSEIVSTQGVPFTQADVTLSFLGERGIVDRRHRRLYPATRSPHLDARVEWHALREEPREG